MRILYVGDLSAGSTCEMRLRTMRALGHDVTALDTHDFAFGSPTGIRRCVWAARYRFRRPPDWSEVNARMIRLVSNETPDVLWIDKGVIIRPKTLIQAKGLRPNLVIAGYSPDDMAAKHNNSVYFVQGLQHYDVYFTTKSYGVYELRALGCPRVEFIGNAYDPTIHRPMELTPAELQRFGSDVGFVGSYEQDRAQQLLFLAGKGIPVRIFGSMWDQFAGKADLLMQPESPVYESDYAKVLNASAINLCFLRKVNRDLQTTRSVEIPACGAFMLAERTDEHRALFEEGKEAEFFSTRDELLNKICFYRERPEKRRQIAAAGRRRCLRGGYSYSDRLRQALACVGFLSHTISTKQSIT